MKRNSRSGRISPLPPQFLTVALLAGFSSSNAVVGLPLLVNASPSPSAYVGLLLALLPLGTALGAFVTAPLRNRLGSAAATLAGAAAVLAIGSVTLTASTATLALAVGMILVGAGIGIFWVCSQVLLSIGFQTARNHSAYFSHYAIYTTGVLTGAVFTGAFAAALEAQGVESVLAARLSLGLGVTASVAAFLVWWRQRRSVADSAGRATLSWRVITNGLASQLQDLLVVSALAIVSLLAPLILLDAFSFSPFAVGVAMGAIALSKIAGTIVTRAITGTWGSRNTTVVALIIGLAACPILALGEAPVYFVLAMLLTSMVLTGIWPLIVAEAQNLAPIALRGQGAAAWNIREYLVIASAGVVGTWLYSSLGRPMMFAAAALLLALAIVVTLRMPLVAKVETTPSA